VLQETEYRADARSTSKPHVTRRIISGLTKVLERHRFALAAFLIPLTIRAIPEIIAGPYPIGYDTIGSYVPFMYDWAGGNFKQQFNPLIGGWIVYAIFGVVYISSHVDPVLLAKISAPALYGVLGFSQYFFSRKVLNWKTSKSLLFVIITSIYFVSLRVSWDLFRNTLALVILFPSLVVNNNLSNHRRVALLSVLVWLVVATHLLVGTLLLGIMIFQILELRGHRLPRTLAILPGGLQFTTSLAGFQLQGTNLFTLQNSAAEPLASYAFLIYIILPLLPMATFGFRQVRNKLLRYWTLVCIVGVVISTTPIATSSEIVTSDRWALMTCIPIAIFAVEGFTRLNLRYKTIHITVNRTLQASWISLILVLSVSFLILPAAQALPYFDYFAPTSMLQSTVPLQDSQSIVAAINWLSINGKPSAAIMADHAMYGWFREYFHGNISVISFVPGITLQQELEQTLQKGYTNVYTIWWVDHLGLYGEPTVPVGFALAHMEDRIGVFIYVQSSATSA